MDKQQALKELKELQARATALEEIINAQDTPKVFAGLQLVSGSNTGFYIGVNGKVINSLSGTFNKYANVSSGQLFPTESSAKKAAKLAELQVTLFRAMAKSWGGSRVPWDDSNIVKYVVKPSSSSRDKFQPDDFWETFHMIAFKTKADRQAFIRCVGEDAISFLIQGMQYEGPELW